MNVEYRFLFNLYKYLKFNKKSQVIVPELALSVKMKVKSNLHQEYKECAEETEKKKKEMQEIKS